MKFFAKIKDIIIKILTKIKCKSSCFNTIDSHDTININNDEFQNIRHDIKNTLGLLTYLIDYPGTLTEEDKKAFKESTEKTVNMINEKVSHSYLKDCKNP